MTDGAKVDLTDYVWVKRFNELFMFYEDEMVVQNNRGAWQVNEDEIVRYPKWLEQFGIKVGGRN